MAYYNSRRARGSSQSFGGNNKRYSNNNSGRGGRRRTGEYIDPAKFVKAAKPVNQEEYTPKYSFADFQINDLLKTNLSANGYEKPSPIQDEAIPFGIDGHDIVGIANTGTGKTAAFAIPIIHNAMRFSDAYSLVIAPTRELAEQIEQEMRKLGKGSGLSSALLIGGTAMGPQLGQLRSNPQMVIGTPGRIKDHIERKSLVLTNFNIVVLDEVDRMLDMGFLPDVNFILQKLSPERQSYFFSATMEPKVKKLITDFAPKHMTVSVKTAPSSDNVDQNVVHYAGGADKIDKLHDLLASNQGVKAIVFDETQRDVERLSDELLSRGFKANSIHGGKSQGQRKRALEQFKNNQTTILVATDVAARGIDVSDITHVINYAIPQTYEDYVHRIGRTGRAGKTGKALTFVAK
jgi:ATP-dependent RNA helicase RhlE